MKRLKSAKGGRGMLCNKDAASQLEVASLIGRRFAARGRLCLENNLKKSLSFIFLMENVIIAF